MDPCFVSSWGTFGLGLVHGLLTAPSWQSCALRACGWALTTDRHPIAPYRWRTGATTVPHCARCYGCRGCALASQPWPLWGAVIRQAARFGPEGEGIGVAFADRTKPKAGRPIAGLGRSRQGAGSARQE